MTTTHPSRPIHLLGWFALLFSLTAGVLLAQPRTASIQVNVNEVLGNVNQMVFGDNMLGYQKGAWSDATPDYSNRAAGMWDPAQSRPVPEMIMLAKNANMTVARWPGGCAAHLFDWKKTIGPVASCPDQQFGLPEFLRLCESMNSVPVITVSDYFGTPQDAADLVEYLNTADDGKHQWASQRTKDGSSKRWNVVWFEYGNETHHGDHHGKRMSASEYGKNYLAYQEAMKAVDPHIKLGAVVATGFPPLSDWGRGVLEAANGNVDFVIHHCYIPSYNRNDGIPDANSLFEVALASTSQIQDYYDEINALTNQECHGRSVPIAVTEFNGEIVQDKPVPYRYTLGDALLVGEMIRVFLQPKNNIAMANFWQFANEYWGIVKGFTYRNNNLVERPPYYVFQLYHDHFGQELINAQVQCDAYETDGGYGVTPEKGKGTQRQSLGGDTPIGAHWTLNQPRGVVQSMTGEVLKIDFQSGEDVNYYHAYQTMPADPNAGYHLTGWIRTEQLESGSGVRFQIGDARGWDATHSLTYTPEVWGTQDWTKVEADYVTLPDAKRIQITVRRVSGKGAISGRAFFRDVTLSKFIPRVCPAVPYLSVNASRSLIPTDPNDSSGKKYKVCLIIENKDMVRSASAAISLNGLLPQQAAIWELTGPSIDATNEKDANNVMVHEVNIGPIQSGFSITIPPHSLSALEIR